MIGLGRLGLLAALVWSAEPAAAGEIRGRVGRGGPKARQTVVYLVDVPGDFKAPEKEATIRQAGKTFIPHVLPVLAGTTVAFTNEDASSHNVFSPDFPPGREGKPGSDYYNLGAWDQGERRSRVFDAPGVYTQLCAFHSQMLAYVVVLRNPYFAVTDKSGGFRIPGVPPGTWKLKIWSERLRPKQLEKAYDVVVKDGEPADVVVEP